MTSLLEWGVDSIFFILGLVWGSFINCVVWRMKIGSSAFKGRSVCVHCNHKLSWFELIPVMSFVFLRGRCSKCCELIPWHYPLVELSVGGLFVLVWWFAQLNNWELGLLIRALFIVLILTIVFLYDALYKLVSLGIIGVGILGVLVFNFFIPELRNVSWIVSEIIGVIMGVGFFWLQYLISKGKWIGIGDVYIGVLMGIILGWQLILVALLISYIVGALVGMLLILFQEKNLRSEVPLGAFLCIGTCIALFFGKYILDWYLHFIY